MQFFKPSVFKTQIGQIYIEPIDQACNQLRITFCHDNNEIYQEIIRYYDIVNSLKKVNPKTKSVISIKLSVQQAIQQNKIVFTLNKDNGWTKCAIGGDKVKKRKQKISQGETTIVIEILLQENILILLPKLTKKYESLVIKKQVDQNKKLFQSCQLEQFN